MIAVDKSLQGRGLGTDLLIDALRRAWNVSKEVGLLVILDVIEDDGNKAFQRRKEF